jgi:hypothetical protein
MIMEKNTWLILVATLGFLALLGGLLFFPIPKDNIQVFIFIAGLVGGFFFGASIKQPIPPTTPITVDNTKGVTNVQETVSLPPGPLDPAGL